MMHFTKKKYFLVICLFATLSFMQSFEEPLQVLSFKCINKNQAKTLWGYFDSINYEGLKSCVKKDFINTWSLIRQNRGSYYIQTPDGDDSNDSGGNPDGPSDNATGGDGSGDPDDENPSTDEDDHDGASFPVEVFDLALTKVLTPGQAATVSPGDVVTFMINIFNQGSIDAYNMVITDYVPA